MNVAVDLCPKCWRDIEENYNLRVTARRPKRVFAVVNEEDIPEG